MGSEIPKQYMTIAGKTILETTLYKFDRDKLIDEIILVVNREDIDYVREDIACNYEKVKIVLKGGKTRTESVYEGIKRLSENCKVVLIHDGVRPFISYRLINTCVEKAYRHKACVPVIDVIDTIKEVRNGYVEKTLERAMLKAVQTPQAFDTDLIRNCYEKAINEDVNFTDDASIVEYYGYKVKTVEGLSRNIKITTPLDLRIAEIFASIY
jgi:2-C-methyl-D-erythritol 4-phosphate cytidylyltransferase